LWILGIAKSLGENVPFMSISASEVYSVGMSKTEALTQAVRRCIGVRVTENIETIEGEVEELEIDQSVTGVRTIFLGNELTISLQGQGK
jgi:RuvB-like protein 2